MKYIILVFIFAFSINLFANERMFLELQKGTLSAESSKISFTSNVIENKTIDFVYLNANEVLPKSVGITRTAKLYSANSCQELKFSDRILYENLYNSIDLSIYKKNDLCKYDFIVYPEGDPSKIEINVSGSVVLQNGNLLYGKSSIISELKPYSYQIINSQKVEVESSFILTNNTIKFKLGKYNHDYPLIIDPEFSFSSLLGGYSNDYGGHLEKDSQGNIYHAFQTESSFLSSTDAKNSKNGSSRSICIMKYSPEMELLWGLYLGSSGTNHVMDIKCDHEDNIWIGGETNSSNFPTTVGAVQTSIRGYFDMILSKVSPDGDLLYSTIYGGGSYDVIAEIDIDSKNNVWATGRTSGGFSTTPGGNTYSGDYDGFVVGLSSKGDLLHSAFIGTYQSDIAEGIAIDSKDNIYVSGHTHSSSSFAKGKYAHQYYGSKDAFLLKYSTDNGIIWSTYYGGESSDWGSNLEIDDFDNIYLSGYTGSVKLPNKIYTVQNGNAGGLDMYLAKFDTEGKNIWSTFYGGIDDEGVNTTNDMYGGLDIFSNGDVLIGGRTTSNNVKMFGEGFQTLNGTQDGLLLVVDTDGNPKWSSYIGGSGYEENIDVLFDMDGEVICSGNTKSSNFPVTDNTPYNTYHGNADAYIVRFGDPCHQSAFELWTNPPADFVTNGEATLQNDTLFMHRSVSQDKGSAWYHEHIPVSVGFTTEFKFRINTYDVNQVINAPNETAGGLAFVIQNNSVNALGQSDFGLGYKDIPNGLAIEFDNFKNDEDNLSDMRDPSDGHIAVMGMNNSLLSPHHDTQKSFKNVEIKDDGTVYQCRIVYSGTNQQMKIYFAEEGAELTEVINLNIDLTYSLNLKEDAFAFLGFTAANGSITQTHDIFDWSVCPSTSSPETSIGEFATNESNIYIFPNPISDNFSIQYSPSKMSYVNINMYDLEGKKVAMLYSGLDQAGTQTISMPVPENISTGVYVIEIDYGYNKETAKLIIK